MPQAKSWLPSSTLRAADFVLIIAGLRRRLSAKKSLPGPIDVEAAACGLLYMPRCVDLAIPAGGSRNFGLQRRQ